MKKVLCLFLSMFILLNIVNMDILRINSSAEDNALEYATIKVVTNNTSGNNISNKVEDGFQTGADLITNQTETKLIKKNDKIYMSLDDICNFTRTKCIKNNNEYTLKQGLYEINVSIEANENAKVDSPLGKFNIQTLTENNLLYCEPEPLMSTLFADCKYYNNMLLIDLPQYTIGEAIDIDFTDYKSDVTCFGIDNTDNIVTGSVKWGLVAQRAYVSLVADIIVDANYGFFISSNDNNVKQYYYEAFNEVLSYDISSSVEKEETELYEQVKEFSSLLEQTKDGNISDTPFTDFYIHSYIGSYAHNGLKDKNSISMFNDTIKDLSTNGKVNEKINSYLNQSGVDVVTNVLFNSILEYIKRSSYDKKVLQMFKTLHSEEIINKYNIPLSANGQFFFQCARDYYNSCGSFDEIVKEVTLNESMNKFSEIILKGVFYWATGGASQEFFETYETILSAEKLREANSSFKPIEKINNSAKYFWLAKMQEASYITLYKIAEKLNKDLTYELIEDYIRNLDFYNRISAVMIETLDDSYQLPTATEREKDLAENSKKYINDLCRSIYKLENCDYNLPSEKELKNKTCDVFKKFFTAEPVETTATTQTTVTTTETTTVTTTTTVTPPTYDVNIIDSGNCGADRDNVKWELYENGTLRIYGKGDMENYDYRGTPWYYKNTIINNVIIENGISSIGSEAFSDCEQIKSITISDSITNIGNSAFNGCLNLKLITIPNDVTSIGEHAFAYCKSLETITLPDSVTSIENSTFTTCTSLKSITVPNSITSIGNFAFAYCSNLKSITIPNNVKNIGALAFTGCKSLEAITIPDNVINIENSTFEGCINLKTIIIPDSVTSIENYAFLRCQSLETIIIPNSVTNIGNYAFDYCTSLKSIAIPDSVTSIGMGAFNKCQQLETIFIPNGILSIEELTFQNCINLTDIYYAGTQEEWNDISIGSYNDCLTKATIHYNSIS